MLELDLTTIILEILNFLALSIGLYFLFFRPVLERVEARAAEKERLEEEIQKKLQEAEHDRQEIETRLSVVDQEITRLLNEAREQIEQERRQMLEMVRKEAEKVRKDDEASIRRYQKQELKEFNEHLLNAMLAISGELIQKLSPPEVHHRLVQEANDYVWNMGKEQAREVDIIRRSIGERTPTVHIVSARELNPDQQRMLARTFSALTDRTVDFKLETDAALYGGVRVRVGDILVDNSIAAQLDQMRSEVSEELQARFPDG